MFKSLKINCDQATTICDKSQYGKASLLEKIKIRIHFLKCSICGLYTKQNTFLSLLYKEYGKNCNSSKPQLTKEEKDVLKKKLTEIEI